MSDTKEVTFVAVITINLPDTDSATNLTVTLRPADSVLMPDGKHKTLQDCTLGELSQFADSLEDEILERYRTATLVDLAIDGQTEVSFNYGDEDAERLPPTELWLEQVVVLPDIDEPAPEILPKDAPEEQEEDQAAVSEEPADEPEQPAGESEGDEQLEGEVEPSVDEAPPAPPERKIIEPEASEVVEEPIDDQPEPVVSVAKAEPVHVEREAPPADGTIEAFITAERPRVRILGRRRPIGHSTWAAADILINEPAFRDAQAHAISSPDREVAGVLVGPPPEKQPDGRYVVHIIDTIIAKHTKMHGASVTYTPESWRYVNDKLAEMYPNDEAVIVGWYHTHPGFGIFLSGMDQFIHQNFFTQIWHVALVLDPLARRSGFFCWDRPQSRVDQNEFPWPVWANGSW